MSTRLLSAPERPQSSLESPAPEIIVDGDYLGTITVHESYAAFLAAHNSRSKDLSKEVVHFTSEADPGAYGRYFPSERYTKIYVPTILRNGEDVEDIGRLLNQVTLHEAGHMLGDHRDLVDDPKYMAAYAALVKLNCDRSAAI